MDQYPGYKEIKQLVKAKAPERYSFQNEPSEPGSVDLTKVLDDLVREIQRVGGVHSIYYDRASYIAGFGKVKLFFVIDEEGEHSSAACRLDEILRVVGTRNILDEDYQVLDPKMLTDLVKFDATAKVEYLHGKEIEAGKSMEDEERFYRLAQLLDIITAGFLERFTVAEVERELDTVETLYNLLELDRVMKLAVSVFPKEEFPNWKKFASLLRQLCSNWFPRNLKRYQELIILVSMAFDISVEMCYRLNQYLISGNLVTYQLDEKIYQPAAIMAVKNSTTIFISEWSPELAWRQRETLKKATNIDATILPISFAMQLYEYAKASHIFGRFVKTSFRLEGIGNMVRSYVSWERAKILDRSQEIYANMGIKKDRRFLFDCNLSDATRMAKAINLVSAQKNRSQAKRLLKLYKAECAI